MKFAHLCLESYKLINVEIIVEIGNLETTITVDNRRRG